jgi:hypothetical protein
MNDQQQTKPDYNRVANRPVGCFYCGASVTGRQVSTPQGNQIKWICPRCNQLVKVGNV